MCFYWKEIEEASQKNILSINEIERIAKNIKYLAYLSITGGDPVLRGDLDEIACLFYRNSGTRFITFTTNGFLPDQTEKIAASILQKCPYANLNISISIDHIGDQHDDIRGVKGGAERARETISRLKKLKQRYRHLHIAVVTVLNYYNKNEIFDIIEYIKEEISPDVHKINLVRGHVREDQASDVSVSEYEKVAKYMKRQGRVKGRLMQALLSLMMDVNLKTLVSGSSELECTAGRRILTLSDDGLMMPCEMLHQLFPEDDFVMGDLRQNDYDINKISHSSKAKNIQRFVDTAKCPCTFECATSWNILYNKKMHPRILKRIINPSVKDHAIDKI